jgi:low temperature requirement protein LtrA
MTTRDETASVDAEERGRHATNLELFLDLVFVFAVTQIASVLGSGLTLEGVGRGLLLAWLVWWLWSQFTWLGTAIDLGDRSTAQFQVLATIPLTLLMAVAIPGAFGASGLQFATAYLAVNLWALAIQGWSLWRDPATRSAWLRYVPLAALAPCVLFAGAFLEGDVRIAVWAAVAVFNVASAVAAGTRGREGASEWTIDPVHFAERHALFVIISLGEIVVAIGTSATEGELGPAIGLGLIAASAVACALWWAYFAYVPAAVERVLRAARGADRGTVARGMFTFGHFPIVFGLVLYAVAAKHAVAHPADPLDAGDLAVMAGSIAFFVGGLLGLQWQAVRRLAPERVVVVIGVAALCWSVGPWIPGVVLLGAVAAMIAIMQAISVRRFERLARAGALPTDDGSNIAETNIAES